MDLVPIQRVFKGLGQKVDTKNLPFEKVNQMSEAEEQAFMDAFAEDLANDDGSAAPSHLDAHRSKKNASKLDFFLCFLSACIGSAETAHPTGKDHTHGKRRPRCICN